VTVAYRKESNKLWFFVPVAILFLLPGKVLIACPLRSQSSARIARSYYGGDQWLAVGLRDQYL
jgi:hypothetical protein